MAQISEKRTSSRSHQPSTAAKENAKLAARSKGIEILDFHESWLEEVEIYKDKLVMCKELAKYRTHHSQHLTPQNYANNVNPNSSIKPNSGGGVGGGASGVGSGVGIQLDGHIRAAAGSGVTSAKTTNAGGGNTKSPRKSPTKSPQKSPPLQRRQISGEKATSPPPKSPTRIVVRHPQKAEKVMAQPVMVNVLNSEPYKKVQMLLKRARDEAFANHTATNIKRTNNNNNNNSSSNNNNSNNPLLTSSALSSAKTGVQISSAFTSSNNHNNNNVAGAAATTSSSLGGGGGASQLATTGGNTLSTMTIKPTNKIVVNTFHGSSLLSAQHHHDDKSKILTQNGLTKSAATALETSLYASLYSHSNHTAHHTHYNPLRMNSGEQSAYVGVSFNKHNNEHDKRHEDDPCADIDDIKNYDDSDSEEDYVGIPFFLDSDASETHQSRHMKQQQQQLLRLPSKESVLTNDSELSVYYKPDKILTPSLFPNVPPYLNFTSHVDKGPPMPAALHRVLKWKLSPVMPKIVKRVVLNSGFRIIKNTTDWMAVWEKHMKSPGFRTIRSHQKYNHIPGSFRIGRKDTMWRSIFYNMKKFGKKEFGFMQKSYIMPDDLETLRQVWPKSASKLTKWIVKPPASARGTGIRVVNKWSQFPKDRPLVVQKYIEHPLLINDNKFDMRLYVVLTSINPLRIYMYKEGLARFASVKYSSELSNLDERCMHLTNYSINKFSQNYAKNEDFNACQGHKWTLQSLWTCLENRGVNTKRLWATLRNLVIRGIVSGESGLNRMYRQNVNFRYNCFELFGFDVLLDENLVPWLLEINISPSLHSELPLDLHVKGPLIQAVLNTALYQVPPKLSDRQQHEILEELNLQGPLCHDRRIFTTCLTAEEVRKHNQFTNRSIEYREEYIDTILDNLLPDDVRCLLIAEDELARCKPLERIFPTNNTHTFLHYIENPRYYNRLLDAWENKYAKDREAGQALLARYCAEKYHLQVSDAAMEKEPNVALTEIDMLHVRKDEVIDGVYTIDGAAIQGANTDMGSNQDMSGTTTTTNTADVNH